MSHNRNKIDECTNDGCPDMTPKQLLEEKFTPDDCRAVERAMGRFNTTTAFLNALRQVLVDLESQPEADALARFLPEMAKVECDSMNAPLTSGVSETERILRIMHSDPKLN